MMRVADHKVLNIMSRPNAIIPRGIKTINGDLMWNFNKGEGSISAVIDTGIDTDHPDLKYNLIGGKNFVPGENPDYIEDDHGHGTHVAGTICANGKILGMAPQSKFLALRVFGKDGSGSNIAVTNAFYYAADWVGPNGETVDTINASLGGPTHDPELEEALNYCVSKGILCCCAAGNEGDGNISTEEISYPAMYYNAMSVGAVDFGLNTTNFSNSNKEVDVAAPGDKILSTYLGGKYAELSGTSMADPHVTGLACLYIARFKQRFNRKPTEEELYILIKALTKDIDAVGLDANTGAGLVQPWL